MEKLQGYNHPDVISRRERLQSETNNSDTKINIDFSVFKKTEEEKEQLRKAKITHKEECRKIGIDY